MLEEQSGVFIIRQNCKSDTKQANRHSPYLGKAKVKYVGVQLFHRPREFPPAEIFPAELTAMKQNAKHEGQGKAFLFRATPLTQSWNRVMIKSFKALVSTCSCNLQASQGTGHTESEVHRVPRFPRTWCSRQNPPESPPASSPASPSYLPVVQLLGQVDIKYMRQNVDQLSCIAQSSTDGVGRVVMLHV